MNSTSIIGFDSAWTDQVKAPGAASIIRLVGDGPTEFVPPRLSSFAQALSIIEAERLDYDRCFIALDQPTIVPNAAGSRPVDKVAASLISWVGGGVQPANRSKMGPRYNPGRRKTFRIERWNSMLNCVSTVGAGLQIQDLAAWCESIGSIRRRARPTKTCWTASSAL